MRAAVAVAAIVTLLAFPPSFGAFLPGIAGPTASSPTDPPPPFPHSFSRSADPVTAGGTSVLIVEVFYHAYRDNEYVVLENIGSDPVDLADWGLSDREGTVVFPDSAAVAARSRIVAARNATSYREDTLDEPEFTFGTGGAPRMLVVDRVLRLNNEGDEVLLLDAEGTVVDAFVYGDSTYDGPGWYGKPARTVNRGDRAVRARSPVGVLDTDNASDWDSFRAFGLGQSELPFASFSARGGATAFLSPDTSSDVLTGLLDRARRRIWASVYAITNVHLGAALESAAARGLDVRVLLEGHPVGGIDPREWAIAVNVSAAGGAVRFLADDPPNGTFARYRFLHAKYAVIDGTTTVIGSENWGDHGFPAPDRVGNRGWHVAIEDDAFAVYFESLFFEDFDPRRRDSRPLTSFVPYLAFADVSASSVARPFWIDSLEVSDPIVATPVIAPDHTLREDSLLGLLRSAAKTLDVEAFHVARTWGDRANPYLEAVIDAARRGVRVRVLLDDTWYNTEDTDPVDNDDTVAYVNSIAIREGLPLAAKLGNPAAHGLTKLHNKGVLVDEERVFVSSLNWNRNAATRNREVGVILESPRIADPFREAFEHDWRDDVTPPVANAGPDLVAHVGATVTLSAAASFDDVGIVRYEWVLRGLGQTAVGRIAEVFLRDVGVVEIVLTVRDAEGNEGRDTVLVTVLPVPPRFSLANPLALPLATLFAVNLALLLAVFRRRRASGKGLSDEGEMEPRG